jgi:hypothetical protein
MFTEVSEEHNLHFHGRNEQVKKKETLLVACLLLVGHLAYSSFVKIETVHFSETSVNYRAAHPIAVFFKIIIMMAIMMIKRLTSR